MTELNSQQNAGSVGNSPTGTTDPKYVILNADDFGFSNKVNAAILKSHLNGALTSASLMVAEYAWQEAVEIARNNPKLGVGLHVVVTNDRTMLPASDIPGLANSKGKFGADPFTTGISYALKRSVHPLLEKEMEAQFRRFGSTGLPWSHADGHQHFHMHPTIWKMFMDLCDGFGVTRVRLPHESLVAHSRSGGDRSFINAAALLVFRILRKRALNDLQARSTKTGKNYFVCDSVYGLLQTGNMNRKYLDNLVPRMQGKTIEIYFHPGAPHSQKLGSDNNYQPNSADRYPVDDVEYAALLDPDFAERLTKYKFKTGSYQEIDALMNI